MAEADLSAFMTAAGRQLSDAQSGLLGESSGLRTAMALSEAELEVKASVQAGEKGPRLETLSAADIRRGALQPGAISTVRVRYVALGGEDLPTSDATTQPPGRTVDDVIEDVRKRPDVVRLDEILGGLRYSADYVPSQRRWLVTARDPQDRLVRDLVIDDPGDVQP